MNEREFCETIQERASNDNPGMFRYAEDACNPWPVIHELVVGSEQDKEQLLIALKYLHDCDIDTDYLAVNALVHLYLEPDKIKVRP